MTRGQWVLFVVLVALFGGLGLLALFMFIEGLITGQWWIG